jgi:nitrogen fixation NifU-like protein
MSPEDRILDHMTDPYHRIRPIEYPNNAIFNDSHDNGCGDKVQIWGRYDMSLRVTEVYWHGNGCTFSQAAASMLAERCESMRLHDVRAMTEDDMLALFGLDVEQGRVECVLVAYRALMKALENQDG